MSLKWHIRLADQAEQDLLEISKWTAKNFGIQQAEHYAETITLAIEALHDGPEILDFHCAYSCPKVARKVMDFDDDKPLSDSVTSKLAVAREQAIQKYREIYI